MSESAIYKATTATYLFLESRAKRDEDGDLIYEGSLIDAFNSTGMSSSYYTPVRKLLDSPPNDPCVTVFRRGNSTQMSLVCLNHPPPAEWKNITAGGLTAGRRIATLIVEVEGRVERLEAWRESIGEVNLSEALLNFERRIAKLERELRNAKKSKV